MVLTRLDDEVVDSALRRQSGDFLEKVSTQGATDAAILHLHDGLLLSDRLVLSNQGSVDLTEDRV